MIFETNDTRFNVPQGVVIAVYAMSRMTSFAKVEAIKLVRTMSREDGNADKAPGLKEAKDITEFIAANGWVNEQGQVRVANSTVRVVEFY